MKQIIAITTGLLMIMGIISVSAAHAGAARRHTIEGFVLGTGVALLGTAIFQEMNKDAAPRPAYTRHWPDRYEEEGFKQYKYRHHRKYAERTRGHWESERVWIAPVYEKRWNPGHYNRTGTWMSGRYENFVIEQGHWAKNKVWVRH
ncbi:MAG: hypothetical protein L3J69_03555 [Desulfobacula sp.]|nr:hypothetical protein [Desulfobacula sp.]